MSLDLSKIDVQPSPSLRPTLEFTVRFRNQTQRRMLILDSRLEAHLQREGSPTLLAMTGQQYYPEAAAEIGRTGETSVYYRVRLDPQQLNEIEQARDGKKLHLRIECVVFGLNLDDVATAGPGFRERPWGHHVIEKSRWVEEFLPIFGHGSYELWEVRFPLMPKPSELSSELRSLQSAIHDYNTGEYEDAFKDCRDIVESIQRRMQELDLENRLGKEQIKRAMHYCSIALHAQSEIPRQINRADAEFAISVCRSILNLLGSGLSRHVSTAAQR